MPKRIEAMRSLMNGADKYERALFDTLVVLAEQIEANKDCVILIVKKLEIRSDDKDLANTHQIESYEDRIVILETARVISTRIDKTRLYLVGTFAGIIGGGIMLVAEWAHWLWTAKGGMK